MKLPDQELIIDQFLEFNKKGLSQIIGESTTLHGSLFPEDYLYGSSLIDKYRAWIENVFLPKIEESGEKGKKILNAIREKKLHKNSQLLAEVVVVLTLWFFPDHENIAATIALLIIIRKIFNDKKSDESSKS
ncbi:hypothetical protein QQ020_00390 [Fulvivirgaceae bacterium BMA12]|uniref:Uncharacterized protein n=1 Tax=Agaribacillus aureus TaxID=3051825 RepID=A0ABT8KYG0_9BACT|nr:hypothetical protein [Fulvivirgaceae bacterium BMA12]